MTTSAVPTAPDDTRRRRPRRSGRIVNVATGTAVPSAPEELEDYLSDPGKMATLFDQNGRPKAEFRTFLQNYAEATMKRDSTIAAQVKEETQRVLAQWLKDNRVENMKRLNLEPGDGQGAVTARQRNRIYNAKAPGAALDKEFADAADFFKSVWHLADHSSPEIQNKRRAIRNAFSSVEPGAGGFLIPETLRAELLSVALETAIVRPRARVIPMDTLKVSMPAVDSTSNASTVYGGIVAYWTEEAATLVQSQASFGRVSLDAKKLTIYTEVPNELLADAGQGFQAFMDQVFPEALAWYEDAAYLYGTGVGEPAGALDSSTNGALVVQAKESGQTADTITYANVLKMYARMLPASLNRAVWIISPDVFPQLAVMTISGGTSPVWLANAQGAPAMTLFGRPVIISEKASLLGDQGDINFVDFGHYLIGDRQTMSAESSIHYKFANDVTAFRIIERVDGRPWMQSAITPRNGGNTLSPYVTLAERA